MHEPSLQYSSTCRVRVESGERVAIRAIQSGSLRVLVARLSRPPSRTHLWRQDFLVVPVGVGYGEEDGAGEVSTRRKVSLWMHR